MEYDLCVIGGLGHVGLPLSIMFACENQKVLVYDINEKVKAQVLSGEMPFLEEDGEKYLKIALEKGNLDITMNACDVSKAKTLVVIIGTPVDGYLNPELDSIMKMLEEITPFVNEGQLIILRSTVFPGTTNLVREYFKKNNKNVGVTFCPERIAEGKAFAELHQLPQIVSAFCEEDYKRAEEIFEQLGCETVRLEPMEAELAKLLTNSWRYCQFAISNQFYMIANNFNLDFYKIYDAITYKYPRLSGLAKAGFAAGPCLYKDTLQLRAFNNNQFNLGFAALTVNEGLPSYIVDKLKSKMRLKEKTVGILGMAFKAGSDDERGSLSYKLRRILRWEAGDVLCTDVYIQKPDILPVEEVIERSDVLILGAPHKEYKDLDFKGKYVVDVWNFYGGGGLIIK